MLFHLQNLKEKEKKTNARQDEYEEREKKTHVNDEQLRFLGAFNQNVCKAKKKDESIKTTTNLLV